MAKQHRDRAATAVDLDAFQPPSGYEPGDDHHRHQKSFTSTRSATHRGKKIKVRTTYRIEIDGEPLTLHTMVMDDGTVHCHGLPNYSFPSAIDLARSIIDASYLAPMERDELGQHDDGDDLSDNGGSDHDSHDHGGHH